MGRIVSLMLMNCDSLSTMYAFLRQQLESDVKADGTQLLNTEEIQPGQEPHTRRYTSHKCKSIREQAQLHAFSNRA